MAAFLRITAVYAATDGCAFAGCWTLMRGWSIVFVIDGARLALTVAYPPKDLWEQQGAVDLARAFSGPGTPAGAEQRAARAGVRRTASSSSGGGSGSGGSGGGGGSGRGFEREYSGPGTPAGMGVGAAPQSKKGD